MYLTLLCADTVLGARDERTKLKKEGNQHLQTKYYDLGTAICGAIHILSQIALKINCKEVIIIILIWPRRNWGETRLRDLLWITVLVHN